MPEKAIENKFRKRGLKVAAIAGGLVLVGGVAFAYWTQGGSGVGSAKTGDSIDVTVKQTGPAVEGLAPGSGPVALGGNFDNPNSGPVYVSSVTVAVGAITKGGNPVAGCDSTDFTLVQPSPVNAEVPAGNAKGAWGGASIEFNDKSDANQDACKGVTVELLYTASAS